MILLIIVSILGFALISLIKEESIDSVFAKASLVAVWLFISLLAVLNYVELMGSVIK